MHPRDCSGTLHTSSPVQMSSHLNSKLPSKSTMWWIYLKLSTFQWVIIQILQQFLDVFLPFMCLPSANSMLSVGKHISKWSIIRMMESITFHLLLSSAQNTRAKLHTWSGYFYISVAIPPQRRDLILILYIIYLKAANSFGLDVGNARGKCVKSRNIYAKNIAKYFHTYIRKLFYDLEIS